MVIRRLFISDNWGNGEVDVVFDIAREESGKRTPGIHVMARCVGITLDESFLRHAAELSGIDTHTTELYIQAFCVDPEAEQAIPYFACQKIREAHNRFVQEQQAAEMRRVADQTLPAAGSTESRMKKPEKRCRTSPRGMRC